ncbi:hypothetical protein SprV_0501896600 [Sparganum proliferum]
MNAMLSGILGIVGYPDDIIIVGRFPVELQDRLSDAIRGIPVTAADILRATGQDPVLRQAINYVQICWPTAALAGNLHQLFLRRASPPAVDS